MKTTTRIRMATTLFPAAALAIGIAGCGIKEEIYNAKVAELDKTRAELAETQRSAEAAKKACAAAQRKLDDENTALKARLAQLGQKAETLAGDLEKSRKLYEEVKKAQEQAERRAAQFRQMVAKFRSMIDAGKLQVEVRNGLMLVKLPDNILFDPGKSELKTAGQEAIRQVTQVLASIEGRSFQVTGHTDNVPIKSAKFGSNWELSTQRAVEVVKFMSKNGMDARRLSAAGYADQMPIAPNDTDEGRRQNRRIEIVVVPNIEDLPPLDEALKS